MGCNAVMVQRGKKGKLFVTVLWKRNHFACYSTSFSFSLFLARFFPFAGYLLSFISMAKVFRKAFRIVGLDGRKCRRVVGKNFMGIFGSILHGFWPFSVASLTEPCSFWYGLTDLSPLHYPWCQRLFMRAFRVWSSLKKWPAPSVEHLSACSQRNKAPRRTRKKTSGTQGTSARDRWQIACSRT